MKFGYLSLNDADGVRPDRLARELEDRGFDSVWMPEHSHIPVSRATPYPGGGDLPDGYWHMMDPFVSLTAAAMATTSLTLATGICLVLEHDLLDLACTVATLDVLSGGRVLLGIGVGWNAEELANHRPDLPFRQRYSAMRERVDALRSIWTEEAPSPRRALRALQRRRGSTRSRYRRRCRSPSATPAGSASATPPSTPTTGARSTPSS